MGLTVVPVSVVINDRTYRDYEEITSAAFLERIAAGGVRRTGGGGRSLLAGLRALSGRQGGRGHVRLPVRAGRV